MALIYLRPDTDASNTGWSDQSGGTTNLYQTVDETTSSDTDYIQSSANPTADIVRFRVSDPGGSVVGPFTVAYRYGLTGTGTCKITARLKQGTTLIKEWAHTDAATTLQTVTQTLSSGELASISDFNDLFMEFEAGAVTAASSVWGDHGTLVSLSMTTTANDTATCTSNTFSTVRGTQAHSTGKHYFEIKILSVPAVSNFIFGVMDNTTANGAAMDDRLLAKSTANGMFNGNNNGSVWTGLNLGAGWSLAANDIMGIAVEHGITAGGTLGFMYLHLNNTYFLGGDPTSGSAGTGNVGSNDFIGARPMLSLWGVTANSGVIQLRTAASDLLYLPSGYTAWG